MSMEMALIVAVVLIIVSLLIYSRVRKEKNVVNHEYKERQVKRDEELDRMEEQDASITGEPVPLDEFEIYVQLLAIYTAEHVAKSNQLISSNRLSPLVKEFSAQYSRLMTKGVPVVDKPYHRIKEVLKQKGLMVKPK